MVTAGRSGSQSEGKGEKRKEQQLQRRAAQADTVSLCSSAGHQRESQEYSVKKPETFWISRVSNDLE